MGICQKKIKNLVDFSTGNNRRDSLYTQELSEFAKEFDLHSADEYTDIRLKFKRASTCGGTKE